MKHDILKSTELEEIYLMYKNEIWIYLASLTRNPEETDVLFQALFLNLIGLVEEKRIKKDTIRALLYKMAHNHLIDSFRKRTNQKRPVASPQKMYEQTDSSRNNISEKIRNIVFEVLSSDRLPKRQKEVMLMRIVGQLDVLNISQILKISRKKVYRELNSGMKELRERFKNEGLTPGDTEKVNISKSKNEVKE